MKSSKMVRKLQLYAIASAVGVGLIALLMVILVTTSLAASDEGPAPLIAAGPSSAIKIGNYVWNDVNANGSFNEAGEIEFEGGIDGVRLNLYKDTNLNGLIDAGEYLSYTVTGLYEGDPATSGWYEFDVQTGATYLVQVDPSNFAPGGALEGMALTSAGTIGSEPRKVIIPPNGAGTFDNVDFGYVASRVVVDKTLLNSTVAPIYAGDGVAFRIVLTNTGYLDLITLPLWDYYGPACLTFWNASVTPDEVDPSLGILHWNNLGPLSAGESVTVTVNFTAATSTAMYWKEGGWPDYAAKGMPDFGQKQDAWGGGAGDPSSAQWRWSHCGPVAAANSLWWFDSKFETNLDPPPTISDTYPLVTALTTTVAWDDHDARNVEPLVDALATQMGTDPILGTTVAGLAAGISQYITDTVGTGQYTVTLQPKPTFSWVADEVRRSEDVILLLGFWQIADISGQPVAFRIGGHYVTVAGADAVTPTIALSDPYTDRAEIDWSGRAIPDPHLSLHATGLLTDTAHNDTKIISHDAYTVTVAQTTAGTWGALDYAQNCSEALVFQGQNVGLYPNSALLSCNDALPVFTEVEYAVAVSPITATLACSPTVNIAVASGVIDALANKLPAAQDETPVTVLAKTNAVIVRSLKLAQQHGDVFLAIGLVAMAVLSWGVWSGLRRRTER